MAVVTFSGDPGCRADHAARILAQRLGFHFLSEAAIRRAVAAEYASESTIPDRLFSAAVTPILARIAAESHIVLACPGAEALAAPLPNRLRIALTASERFRTGSFMLDHSLDRTSALALLHQLEREERALRKRRFGRMRPAPSEIDLVCNAETLDADRLAAIAESAAASLHLTAAGLLPHALEAELQFNARVSLARHGIAPAAVPASHSKPFANDSEQVFASLLDFYRIAWEYEPRTFPIEWDNNGRVTESFTPDFLLPEFDLYIELTTMKQAHVTRKNRKVRRLRAIYPNINIQVFYQKDFHNLIFKYGLAAREVAV